MLEEAAGIAGLHVRRKDAEQKLRATEANLVRLDEILADMELRGAALKRQARAAERLCAVQEDLGHLDDRGNLVITGRIKDVIVRKGENVSAKEVEDLLITHPLLADVDGRSARWYEEALATAAPEARPLGERSGDDLYLCYTGGTTGMPKGVVLTHGNFIKRS